MLELLIADGEGSFEYFCHSCKQLRLSLNPKLEACGNCGTGIILKGAIGTLDKDTLMEAQCPGQT